MQAADALSLPASSAASLELRGHRGACLSVSLNVKGNYALSCGADRTVRLWNASSGAFVRAYEAHSKAVHCAQASADNASFASAGADRQAVLTDVASGSVLRRWRGHAAAVHAVALSANAQVCASGSYDATVRLWDARSHSPEPIQTLHDFGDAVTWVACEEAAVVAASVDGSVRTFDLRAGEVRRDVFGAPIGSAAISGDGNCLLAATLNDVMRLLDRTDGEELQAYRGHVNRSARVGCAFTHDDAAVVAGDENGALIFWDLVEGTTLRTIKRAHEGAITAVAAHPSQPAVVTAGADGLVKVWR